jgi:Tfp pilus assembly protein PilF
MSEEDKRTIDGGPDRDPADSQTERRNGERRSDFVHRDAAVSDDGKETEMADADEGKVFLPGDNKTREEIESQFRNDPRFAMLFDHSEKTEKAVSRWNVKVAGVRLTPKRILILAGFLLVVLFCLGGSLFYAFKDLTKYRNFKAASALLESGDYDGARKLFVKVLHEDPNKEAAVEAMARIYHHFGDWNNEAFFRQRIMRLNPLNHDAFQAFLESAFRARNFGSIYSLLNLKVMDNQDLSPEEGAMFVIASLNSGHSSVGKTFYEARKKANPDFFSSTEHGRLAEFLLNSGRMDMEQARNSIETLDRIQNPQVRFETIYILVRFLSKQNDREADEKTEKLLLEAARLNNFAGAPLLANYYFSHYRFDDTIRICEDYLKTKINAVIPIFYGESCVLNGQPEQLQSIIGLIRPLRGRQAKIIVAYLEALKAFCEGDDARLPLLLQSAGSTIETPLSSLMRFHVALKQDSAKEIQNRLFRIMRERPFLDFQQRARTAALQYLLEKSEKDLASSPDLLNTCAEIAALIQTPDDDVSFLQRIIIADRFKRNVLTDEEMQSALQTFPGDPVLLLIATRFCLTNGKPDRAMEHVTEYMNLKDVPEKNKSSADVLHMLALDQLGRKDEAEKEFRSLVEKDEKGDLLCLYFEFCIENGFVDSLKSLAAWLDALPEDSSKRTALPFVRAEILFAEGKKDEALALFEKSASGDPRFVFHAASRLAEAGRNDAAFSHYLSIRNSYPDKALVNLNLSGLYFEKGDMKNALASAEAAWRDDPKNLLVRYIYAKRLFEAGRYAEAVSALKFPQHRASFPKEMLELWSQAIHAQIKADFDAERYAPAMENTKFLLIYFPEDKSGRDYFDKLEKIRRHESVGGATK